MNLGQRFKTFCYKFFVKQAPLPRYGVNTPTEEILKIADYKKLEQKINYQITEKKYFFQALSHRSFLTEFPNANLKSNERLEFLGDSILNMVVGEFLFELFPTADEGSLTKMRSRLVNRKSLASYGHDLELWDLILLSSSVAQSLEKGSDTILADCFEAIIGALYLDAGMEPVNKFIRKTILSSSRIRMASTVDQNYKSLLLEHSQAAGSGVPRYTIIKWDGPDHDRIFTVEVKVNNEIFGAGTGKNKKEAEQAAAAEALKKIKILNINEEP
jgi:ribonuclease III